MQAKTVKLKNGLGEQVYPVAYPGGGLPKEVIVIDGIEMTQEELTSAFEDLKTFMETLMLDEGSEGAIDWNTVDREYIFKNVLGQDINDLFENWGQLHFADVYYWDEVCNEDGIDVKSELAQRFID